MTADTPSVLVPNLRFSEFRGALHWDTKPLAEMAHVIAGQSPRGENYNTTGNGVPFYQGKADFGDLYLKKPTKWTTQVTKLAQPSDILMSVRAPVGALNLPTEQICIGRGLASLQPSRGVKWFLYYTLLGQQGQIVGNGGSVFDSINKEQIEKLPIPTPPTIAEQQKIAGCLGSLDDLIAAEGRKLEALRLHKKGLMQQLFPQPGETVPRLRFPEFEGAGDWEEKRLASMVKLVSGVHLAPDMYSTVGDVPYFTGPSDFTDAIQCVGKWTAESVNTAKQHDTLITVKGSGVGEIWYLTLPSIAIGRQLMAVRTEIGDRRFIYQFLFTRRTQFKILASGNLIPGLSRGDILGLAAYFPSRDEQQKISDCLGSLDDLIVAKVRKLEALRQHKKGLMQQMFPSLERH